jgi:dolichol-phosphate mannosyltransferase
MQASPFSHWPVIGPLADRLWPLVQWFLRWRYARFAVVGASGTVVNMLVLYVLQEWLLRGIEPAQQRLYLSLAGAIALATVNNFCWNSWWTWSDRLAADQPVLALNGATAMRFVTYAFASWLGIGIQYVLTLWLSGHMYYLLANLIAIVVASISNFVANDRWTFRRRPPP